MKHSNRVKVQRLFRILKVRYILLLRDYRAGLPEQNYVTHSALMTFDNQTQQFGGKFEMSTYFYSNVIWLELGSKIATLASRRRFFHELKNPHLT